MVTEYNLHDLDPYDCHLIRAFVRVIQAPACLLANIGEAMPMALAISPVAHMKRCVLSLSSSQDIRPDPKD